MQHDRVCISFILTGRNQYEYRARASLAHINFAVGEKKVYLCFYLIRVAIHVIARKSIEDTTSKQKELHIREET